MSLSSSYMTAHTEWPTSVTVRPEVRRLLARFYYLLDIPDTSVGHRFAEEVFTSDGVMFGMGPGFRGEGTFTSCLLRCGSGSGLGVDGVWTARTVTGPGVDAAASTEYGLGRLGHCHGPGDGQGEGQEEGQGHGHGHGGLSSHRHGGKWFLRVTALRTQEEDEQGPPDVPDASSAEIAWCLLGVLLLCSLLLFLPLLLPPESLTFSF